MIVFENIHTGETYGISQKTEGKFYRAKLSALMNSSNMNINADRGQDFGVRLIPEQQALIELWESDPQMIDKVSVWSKVMLDDLTHAEFLAYLLYQQELGNSPEKGDKQMQRDNQREYEARVAAIRSSEKITAMPAFEPKVARGEETVEDFLSGDLTGDASGDKVEPDVTLAPDSLEELDKVIAETGNEAPKIDSPVVGTDTKPAPSKAPKAKK